MKKAILILFVLIIVVVVGAVVAVNFIPFDTYKGLVAEKVKEATGRDLAIKGKASLSLFPQIAIELNDVNFSNAPGAKEKDMARLAKLSVKLKLWPLLKGEIAVDQFVLVDPVIHLEVDRRGRPNWEFQNGAGPKGAPAPAAKGDGGGGGGSLPLTEVRLGDVRLVNGLITYADAKGGQSERISKVNMTLSLPQIDGPFAANGRLTWKEKEIKLETKVANLKNVIEGKSTAVSMKIGSEPLAFGFGGSVVAGRAMRVSGDLDLSVPSIRKLAAWTGNPIAMEGSGLGPLKIQGKVGATQNSVSFTGAKIQLDEMKAAGEVSVALRPRRPAIKGKLEIDRLNLNPYLPPEEKASANGAGKASAPAKPASSQAPADWSDEPIELGALGAVDADFALRVGGILYRKIRIDKGALALKLVDRNLEVDLQELALYEGNGRGKLILNGRVQPPTLAQEFQLSGVQAQPLLRDAMGMDRLSGKAESKFAVSAKGRSQRELIRNLGGNGGVTFRDGAIHGVNLGAMVRNVKSAFLNPEARKEVKTDFAELSGTFRITSGILRNDDLSMQAPLLRLTGKGTVDLPQKRLDYRLTPKAALTAKGQGGRKEVAGVTVPVIVKGPWHDLSYRPDLEGVLKEGLKDPSALKEKAKELEGVIKDKEKIKDVLKGIFR